MLVVVRRIANCRVAARTHVDLARTHGVVPLRSRVGSKRLAHGVYVVTVWRVESTTPVRTTVIRVRRDHRVVRLHRRAPTCRSGAVAGGPVAGAPAPRATGAVAVLTGFAGATPAISLTPPTTEIASRPVVAATSGASKVRVPTPAEISRAAGGGVFGALFAGALIALLVACPIAIAVYVWRFLHAPAEPS